jgi:hypothetical protein
MLHGNAFERSLKSAHLDPHDTNIAQIKERFENSCTLFLSDLPIVKQKRESNLFTYSSNTVRQTEECQNTVHLDEMAKNSAFMKYNFFAVVKVIS